MDVPRPGSLAGLSLEDLNTKVDVALEDLRSKDQAGGGAKILAALLLLLDNNREIEEFLPGRFADVRVVVNKHYLRLAATVGDGATFTARVS